MRYNGHRSQVTGYNCACCKSDNTICVDNKNLIFKCKNCGFYFAQGVNYISPEYKNTSSEEILMSSLETLRRDNYKNIINKIKNKFSDLNGVRGLDVGCARGGFMDEAGKNNIKMDGIEPEKNFFNEAQSYGENVVNGLFPQDFNLNFKYDFIIFNDVFEHLPNLDVVFKKCGDLLKPGGLLIINCPDSRGIFFKIASILKNIKLDSPWRRLWQLGFYSPHLWYFNDKNLKLLTEKYNFKYESGFKLKVITRAGLKERVMCSAKNFLSGYITYLMILFASPFLNILHGDIMCAIFKK